MYLRRGKRCFIRLVSEPKDYDFVGEMQEQGKYSGAPNDVDFIGWTIHGDATKQVGISYTISNEEDSDIMVVAFAFEDSFMKKLWKQLKRDDIYTFTEDFINVITAQYKEMYRDKKIIVEIPYSSKTLKLLFKKNGYVPTHTVLVKE